MLLDVKSQLINGYMSTWFYAAWKDFHILFDFPMYPVLTIVSTRLLIVPSNLLSFQQLLQFLYIQLLIVSTAINCFKLVRYHFFLCSYIFWHFRTAALELSAAVLSCCLRLSLRLFDSNLHSFHLRVYHTI